MGEDFSVGLETGATLGGHVGVLFGAAVGCFVGFNVGTVVTTAEVGDADGECVGLREGACVG